MVALLPKLNLMTKTVKDVQKGEFGFTVEGTRCFIGRAVMLTTLHFFLILPISGTRF
jgi:hypothetical protein